MQRVKFVSLLILVLVLASCVGIQERWNALTPDEKARIIINDLQTQLNDLFDRGKLYVDQNPRYQEVWRNQIIPLFDTANQSIKTAISLSRIQGATPDQIYSIIQPNLDKVVFMLVQIGAINKK